MRAIQLMEELFTLYPQYSLGRHLSSALADYGDFWDITDKELCFALEKYSTLLELDEQNISPDEYVNDIIEDGKHLFDVEDEEEEE